MNYTELAYLHLATVLPAFAIGTFLLLNKKGTGTHKGLGKIYLILMMVTAIVTLAMPAAIGPRWANHFGFIHLFCFVVLYSAPSAYFAIRSGNIKKHKGNMIGLYVGGLLIVGAFALRPGRMLFNLLFG